MSPKAVSSSSATILALLRKTPRGSRIQKSTAMLMISALSLRLSVRAPARYDVYPRSNSVLLLTYNPGQPPYHLHCPQSRRPSRGAGPRPRRPARRGIERRGHRQEHPGHDIPRDAVQGVSIGAESRSRSADPAGFRGQHARAHLEAPRGRFRTLGRAH